MKKFNPIYYILSSSFSVSKDSVIFELKCAVGPHFFHFFLSSLVISSLLANGFEAKSSKKSIKARTDEFSFVEQSLMRATLMLDHEGFVLV